MVGNRRVREVGSCLHHGLTECCHKDSTSRELNWILLGICGLCHVFCKRSVDAALRQGFTGFRVYVAFGNCEVAVEAYFQANKIVETVMRKEIND